jgi:hypothetical protein
MRNACHYATQCCILGGHNIQWDAMAGTLKFFYQIHSVRESFTATWRSWTRWTKKPDGAGATSSSASSAPPSSAKRMSKDMKPQSAKKRKCATTDGDNDSDNDSDDENEGGQEGEGEPDAECDQEGEGEPDEPKPNKKKPLKTPAYITEFRKEHG